MDMEISTSAEHAAVSHILAAPLIVGRTARHIRSDDFDWDALRQETETMSDGEALLVRIADELWNAERKAGLWEVVRRLDDANFERVVGALRLHRRAPLPSWVYEEPLEEQRAA
jgi:hypothetical protein